MNYIYIVHELVSEFDFKRARDLHPNARLSREELVDIEQDIPENIGQIHIPKGRFNFDLDLLTKQNLKGQNDAALAIDDQVSMRRIDSIKHVINLCPTAVLLKSARDVRQFNRERPAIINNRVLAFC